MSGYVAMSRDWQAHDIFEGDEFSRRDAWAWLIAHAAWKPTTTRIKGAKVELGRGEMTFSVRFLAEKWGWSKSKVDRFIALLREEGMIESRSKSGTTAGHAAGQGQSILTICNYDKYQPLVKPMRDNDGTSIGTTAGQQRDKEETGNTSVTNVTGETPPLSKMVFDQGVALLKASGRSDGTARSLVGKWRKTSPDATILQAIEDCARFNVAEPVEWMTKRLAARPKTFLDAYSGRKAA